MKTRNVFRIVWAVILACAAAHAEGTTLEREIKALAARGLPGPVVAILGHPQMEYTLAPGGRAPSSVRELAAACGLQVFQQNGVYVIAEPMRVDLGKLMPPPAQPAVQSTDEGWQQLLATLSDRQLGMLGTNAGLPVAALNMEQQALMAEIAKLYDELSETPDDSDNPAHADLVTPVLPRVSIFAQLRCFSMSIRGVNGEVDNYDPNEDYNQEAADAEMQANEAPEPGIESPEYPEVPSPPDPEDIAQQLEQVESQASRTVDPSLLVPNTLKPSNLDYGRSELQRSTSIDGKTNLRDLILQVARETGLDLKPSLGADKVPLYVAAGGASAGSILAAVALATEGTWRQVADEYLFVPDLRGLGQIAATWREAEAAEEALRMRVRAVRRNPMWLGKLLSALPFDPRDRFVPTPAQVRTMLAKFLSRSEDEEYLRWSSLTPIQRALIGRITPGAFGPIESVTPHISVQISLGMPGQEMVSTPVDSGTLNIFPEEGEDRFFSMFTRSAPSGISLPINTSLRGLLLEPTRSDTPAAVVSMMEKKGLNTLFLRVFSDGYTVFPSEQFPRRPVSREADYLADMLAAAHASGIKVFAAVDVLRWSDGSRSHWLRKHPELLDYDILGRTQSEGSGSRTLPDELRLMLPFIFGDAFQGDVVSPLSPGVAERLRALLVELAAYPVDGLALDHTMVWNPSMLGSGSGADTGQPGYSDQARLEFIRAHGIDPIDAVPAACGSLIGIYDLTSPAFPLMPVYLECCLSAEPWALFYQKSCDNMLDGLLTKWKDLGKGTPVWVVDTYGAVGSSDEPHHDWARFKGRVEGILNILAIDSDEYPGQGLKRVTLLRPCDTVGSLITASFIAMGQGLEFPGMISKDDIDMPPFGEGVVFDFSGARKKKAEFLGLIKGPAKTP